MKTKHLRLMQRAYVILFFLSLIHISARMGSTRSTNCAANARTEESRSSATKSVTPTTVMSRYCFVFGSMKKSFPGADG